MAIKDGPLPSDSESSRIERPSLETILDQARLRFVSQETYDPYLPESPKYGKFLWGYAFDTASDETAHALAESGINMQALAGEVMTATPSRLDDDITGDTWEELSRNIVARIIRLEMPIRFPDLVAENERRMGIDTEE